MLIKVTDKETDEDVLLNIRFIIKVERDVSAGLNASGKSNGSVIKMLDPVILCDERWPVEEIKVWQDLQDIKVALQVARSIEVDGGVGWPPSIE